MTFDPRTDYLDDYQYFDFTEVADWLPNNEGIPNSADHRWRTGINGIVIREEDITEPDFASVSVGVDLVSPDSTVFCIWNPSDQDFSPRASDVIRRDDGTTWVVRTIRKQPFGRWIVMADKVKPNT